MTDKEILAFRTILAEGGTEMTPRQAEKAYKTSKSIVRTSRMMSMLDIWSLQETELEGMSEQEREELVELYKTAKEL